ncbi:hypothetical protein HPP92_025962 [Vanilla planifolia]|uniref:Uncharacterized protein n=1 Tax=Vanilla planifolia TaxID=51239 RepID=A0A835PGX6_VANPL|nr:hypothetical protein HPP92_026231 [Vanilla planifolia]KAG0451951.1 hypothetical protein HPP92_025962 [Vanilla planifolia]
MLQSVRIISTNCRESYDYSLPLEFDLFLCSTAAYKIFCFVICCRVRRQTLHFLCLSRLCAANAELVLKSSQL